MSCLGEDSLSDEFVLWNFKYAKLYWQLVAFNPPASRATILLAYHGALEIRVSNLRCEHGIRIKVIEDHPTSNPRTIYKEVSCTFI